MDQQSTPTTTADSAASGRLVTGVGSGKKRCLKCAMKKKTCSGSCGKSTKYDGKGGESLKPPTAPGYGAPAAINPSSLGLNKPHSSSMVKGGLKIKGIKKMKMLGKSSLGKMKIGKIRKNSIGSGVLKGIISSIKKK